MQRHEIRSLVKGIHHKYDEAVEDFFNELVDFKVKSAREEARNGEMQTAVPHLHHQGHVNVLLR